MSVLAGVATGIGSWPGTDPRESAATIVGELPSLPHLVELPARGAGADVIGRAGALLVDLQFDTTTRGYRVVPRPGNIAKRARDFLVQDLDALEEAWESAGLGNMGVVKVQTVGPLTLAAEVELANGHRVLTDPGAVRDVAESLAEGVKQHVAEVRRRLGAQVVVQLDEPSLGPVLAGTLRGVTGVDQVRALPAPDTLSILDTVVRGLDAPVALHTCASSPPWELLRRSAADAVSFDVSLVRTGDLDGIGNLLDAGKDLVLGLVPTTAPTTPPTWREAATPAAELLDRLGFGRSLLRDRVGVSPACGLAGATDAWARRALQLCNDVRQAFADEPETL